MNNRTHRKILVVDGTIGFTGGVGISDEWLGNAQDEHHWRDSHYRIEGPVVGQLQSAFMDNWLATHPSVLMGEDYFPKIKPDGPLRGQVFKSAAREGAASAQLLYLLALTAAKKEILISNAYFVPGKLALDALVAAARRGVAVKVILPGPFTDSRVAQWASKHLWGALLEAGIEIYEYQPTMYHCKVMIVDRLLTSVGSTNFDDRSFRLNAESNLNLIDPEFAIAQAQVFEKDRLASKRVTLEEWRNRPWKDKARGLVSSWFQSQL